MEPAANALIDPTSTPLMVPVGRTAPEISGTVVLRRALRRQRGRVVLGIVLLWRSWSMPDLVVPRRRDSAEQVQDQPVPG